MASSGLSSFSSSGARCWVPARSWAETKGASDNSADSGVSPREMGITCPRRAQAAISLAPLLVEENTPQHMACWPHRWPCQGRLGHPQRVCRRFAKGCKLPTAAKCRARAGNATARPFPRQGSTAAGAGWEQHRQLQHPPAPSFHGKRGNRNAKCHLLLRRRRGLPSCLSSANRE